MPTCSLHHVTVLDTSHCLQLKSSQLKQSVCFELQQFVFSQPCVMPAYSCFVASVYSGYEVDDDWCASVLQSYQAERDVLFPWSVGKHTLLSHLPGK